MNTIPLLLLVLLAACVPRQEPADSLATVSSALRDSRLPDGIRGVVRVVGSAPMNLQLVLQAEDGHALRLTGPLEPELNRLSGVEVAVRGTVSPSPDPIVDRQLEATGYEILAVDGRPVVVGEIVSIAAGSARLRTEAGEEIVLSGAPSDFRVGQKVWVQGPTSVVVQSYGTIRP